MGDDGGRDSRVMGLGQVHFGVVGTPHHREIFVTGQSCCEWKRLKMLKEEVEEVAENDNDPVYPGK